MSKDDNSVCTQTWIWSFGLTLKKKKKPGIVVHIYNPSTEEVRAREALSSQCSQFHEFQAKEKPHLKH